MIKKIAVLLLLLAVLWETMDPSSAFVRVAGSHLRPTQSFTMIQTVIPPTRELQRTDQVSLELFEKSAAEMHNETLLSTQAAKELETGLELKHPIRQGTDLSFPYRLSPTVAVHLALERPPNLISVART